MRQTMKKISLIKRKIQSHHIVENIKTKISSLSMMAFFCPFSVLDIKMQSINGWSNVPVSCATP